MSSFCHEYINEKICQLLGRQGDKPLDFTQLSKGANMHKSNITSSSFFIKSPLVILGEQKKRSEAHDCLQPKYFLPLHRTTKVTTRGEIITNKRK